MRIQLTCPACGTPLVDGRCENCGFSVNPFKYTTSAPRWFRDSVEVLQLILRDKPEFVFADYQLFDSAFKKDSVVAIPSDSKCFACSLPSGFQPKELICYKGVPSFIYAEALYDLVDPDVRSVMKPCTSTHKAFRNMSIDALMTYHVIYTSDKGQRERAGGYDAQRALAAYTAPTWLDAIINLTGHYAMVYKEKTASEIMYSYIACDKSMILKHFPIEDALQSFIKSSLAFVNDSTVRSVSVSKAAEYYMKGVPELYVNNLGEFDPSDFNGYLFAQYRTVPNFDESETLQCDAEFLHKLWCAYGAPQSLAISYLKERSGSKISRYISLMQELEMRLNK